MTRYFLLLLSLVWIHTANTGAMASTEDRVTSAETEYEVPNLPFVDESDLASRSARSAYCSEQQYCPHRGVWISCTAQGNQVSCSAGNGWVRCQAGNQVSQNRC